MSRMGLVDPLSKGQGDHPSGSRRRAPRQGVIVGENLAFHWEEGLEKLAMQCIGYISCITFCGAPSIAPADLL